MTGGKTLRTKLLSVVAFLGKSYARSRSPQGRRRTSIETGRQNLRHISSPSFHTLTLRPYFNAHKNQSRLSRDMRFRPRLPALVVKGRSLALRNLVGLLFGAAWYNLIKTQAEKEEGQKSAPKLAQSHAAQKRGFWVKRRAEGEWRKEEQCVLFMAEKEKKSRFFPFTGKPCNCSARFKGEALLSGSFPSHVGVVCPPLWLTHRVLSLSEDLFDVAIPKRGGAPSSFSLFSCVPCSVTLPSSSSSSSFPSKNFHI